MFIGRTDPTTKDGARALVGAMMAGSHRQHRRTQRKQPSAADVAAANAVLADRAAIAEARASYADERAGCTCSRLTSTRAALAREQTMRKTAEKLAHAAWEDRRAVRVKNDQLKSKQQALLDEKRELARANKALQDEARELRAEVRAARVAIAEARCVTDGSASESDGSSDRDLTPHSPPARWAALTRAVTAGRVAADWAELTRAATRPVPSKLLELRSLRLEGLPRFRMTRAAAGATHERQTFYFVRHGEAVHNVAKAEYTGPGKWYDQPQLLDAPLSERGMEQARSTRLPMRTRSTPTAHGPPDPNPRHDAPHAMRRRTDCRSRRAPSMSTWL